MTKELEALKIVDNAIKKYSDMSFNLLEAQALLTLEEALQRLDAIDNANPSEALEELFKTTYFGSKEEYDKINNCYNSIKLALQRLEQIDNSNSSKALECLERIDNTLCLNNIKGKLEFGIDTEEHTDCDSVIGMTEELDTIKQYILKAQEQEKVLEILRKKRVDLPYLRCCFEDNQSVERYNEYIRNKTMDYDHEQELTEEEFDLVKKYVGKGE